jgi:hypothetical protein
MDTFESCKTANELLISGDEAGARDLIIKTLAQLEVDPDAGYEPLLNRLIRDVGLYPYLDMDKASWEERFVYEAFKAEVGEKNPVTLHREQRRLLTSLLSGQSIAVSAPTSFGKSFVIDAFISIRQPKNVVILVPTIALADETRRRLQRKFGSRYKIITTSDQELDEANILVFPQERAIGYAQILKNLDILIVDEFYKASKAFDKERAPALLRSILEFGKIAKQRYFLAPNISELGENEFTRGMKFMRMDFNTVFLEKHELYQQIGKDEVKKSTALIKILRENDGKSLIYAGTYSNIRQIANLLATTALSSPNRLLIEFQRWLTKHYELNWELTRLVSNGVGIHNGQLHRSLSQIQIKLFEEEKGLNQIVSTSSIIEGVNTSAKNVILWSNKNGQARLNDFTYKNIIGRGGRMFRHFIGRIFVLEQPPQDGQTELSLEYPDELLGFEDSEGSTIEYTPEQLAKIHEYESEMGTLIGMSELRTLQESGVLHTSDAGAILAIAREIRNNRSAWRGLAFLNSEDPSKWDRMLYQLIKLQPGAWETKWSTYVEFVKVLAKNWQRSIPELLDELTSQDVGIEEFFKLERITTFRLASLLGDVQTIYNLINKLNPVELSPAIARFSSAFLPRVVFQLEEYGLPRMISRKLCRSRLIDLESIGDIQAALNAFRLLGLDAVLKQVAEIEPFERYILKYFFEGIAVPSDVG